MANFTMVPDWIFEEMPNLDKNELRVLLAICRKTIGYQKYTDKISLSQFEKMIGTKGSARITNALKSLQKAGFIEIDKSTYVNTYSIPKTRNATLPVTPRYGNQERSVTESGNAEFDTRYKYKHRNNTNGVSSDANPGKYSPEDSTMWDEQKPIDYKSFVEKFNELHNAKTRVTDKKRKHLKARLRNFTGDEIIKAWENRAGDDWINNDGKKFKGDFTAAIRNDEKIERYLNRNTNSDGQGSPFRSDAVHY